MIDTAAVEAIEAAAILAWPAARSMTMGDWAVGLSDGHTKRANAASAIRSGARLDESLRRIEAAYAADDRAALFRLTPLADAGCDALLEAAGYRACDASIVMTIDRDDEVSVGDVAVATRPAAAWLASASMIAGHDDGQAAAHAALLARIDRPTGFATVVDRGVTVALGMAVADRGIVGLFDLAVAPAHRGRGHGRTLVAGLRRWGGTMGARRAWLQVSEANARALSLYAAAGFTAAYRYHYRVAPGAPTAG